MAVIIPLETGHPRFGIWCPVCKLSSGFEIPIHTLSPDGVGTVAVYRACHDCGEPIKAEGES